MRIVGLDVGDKTIGVALSDEMGIVATPLKVIQRTASVRKDIGEIRALVEEFGVGTIVVGMPLMLAGTAGIQAEKVQAFVEELRKRIHVAIKTWDERLTTVEAERMLIEADQSRAKRKAVIDKLAASIMLQSYLDCRQHRENSEHIETA